MYRTKSARREMQGAQEVGEDEDTQVDLPIDQVMGAERMWASPGSSSPILYIGTLSPERRDWRPVSQGGV